MKLITDVDIRQEFGSIYAFGTGKGLNDLVSVVLKNSLVIAGVILLFLLIFGGISLMMSAGGSNKEGAARGKKAVTSALAGFVIIFVAYWIIQLIGFLTGINIL